LNARFAIHVNPRAMNTLSRGEPNPITLQSVPLRYFLATRPAFLTVTLVGCFIGLASAYSDGVGLSRVAAIVTVSLALIAHAAINVLNDYYDALNGTDAINTERVFPYTGGSRFIQNGVLSLRQTLIYGAILMAIVALGGVWLMSISHARLMYFGLAGLFIGWAYSAPPFKLNSRGLGELCVWAGFALIAVGADFVQRGAWSWRPLCAAGSYALLATNILYINQFPDRSADAHSGKRHWVVRLQPEHARWGYVLIAMLAYGWLMGAIALGRLPTATAIALPTAIVSALAARDLLRWAQQPAKLASAIKLTIAAALSHGMLLSASLLLLPS
jgi:1,4-dihydroxy-2-naphthoate octaprenyltransferase